MPYQFPRCQVTPLPNHQVAFTIDGQERLRWHCGAEYPRPFFFPLIGPSGHSLTRLGHPGAPNHDHHRSIWFAHHKVLGIDFWADGPAARIRQQEWLCYQDGAEECLMAVRLGWYDGHDPAPLLEQELIAAVRPGEAEARRETFVELQATFRPRAEMLEFGQTNFGFLAVRVATNISAHFGGGELTNSEGRRGEPQIFSHPARWMDYSGPMPSGEFEGITYFDHPDNPRYPAPWHVREDGWMVSAVCLNEPLLTTQARPLVLRYMLHAHRNDVVAVRADQIAAAFAATKAYAVQKSTAKHQQWIAARVL